jgi:hypothetical protein
LAAGFFAAAGAAAADFAAVFAAVVDVVVVAFAGVRSSLTVSFVDEERGVAMLTPFAGGEVRLGST